MSGHVTARDPVQIVLIRCASYDDLLRILLSAQDATTGLGRWILEHQWLLGVLGCYWERLRWLAVHRVKIQPWPSDTVRIIVIKLRSQRLFDGPSAANFSLTHESVKFHQLISLLLG